MCSPKVDNRMKKILSLVLVAVMMFASLGAIAAEEPAPKEAVEAPLSETGEETLSEEAVEDVAVKTEGNQEEDRQNELPPVDEGETGEDALDPDTQAQTILKSDAAPEDCTDAGDADMKLAGSAGYFYLIAEGTSGNVLIAPMKVYYKAGDTLLSALNRIGGYSFGDLSEGDRVDIKVNGKAGYVAASDASRQWINLQTSMCASNIRVLRICQCANSAAGCTVAGSLKKLIIEMAEFSENKMGFKNAAERYDFVLKNYPKAMNSELTISALIDELNMDCATKTENNIFMAAAGISFMMTSTDDMINQVVDLINAIGAPELVTLESGPAIKAAREAYDALDAVLQEEIPSDLYLKLYTAEQNYIPFHIADTISKIADIEAVGDITLDESIAELIQKAREAYDEIPLERQSEITNFEILEHAEKIYHVMDLIAKIGEVTKLSQEQQIIAARVAYNALSLELKPKIGSFFNVLLDAETALDTLKVQAVIDKIEAIGTVTLDSEATIAEARAVYNGLKSGLKQYVSNYGILREAENELIRLKASRECIEEVERLISAIGSLYNLTLESEPAIKTARQAFNELPVELARQVSNRQTLGWAEERLELLKNNAVSDVQNMIGTIGPIRLSRESKIVAARKAYDALPLELKAKVHNYVALEDAERTLAILKAAEKEYAKQIKKVVELIGSIEFPVTLDSKAAIAQAWEEYNKLPEELKEGISNFNVLVAATETWNSLDEARKSEKPEPTPAPEPSETPNDNRFSEGGSRGGSGKKITRPPANNDDDASAEPHDPKNATKEEGGLADADAKGGYIVDEHGNPVIESIGETDVQAKEEDQSVKVLGAKAQKGMQAFDHTGDGSPMSGAETLSKATSMDMILWISVAFAGGVAVVVLIRSYMMKRKQGKAQMEQNAS
ncbi:MAG: hypothetical protein ACOYJC_05985 [Christensenellales bacterium]|jgi:hypothetical protein